MSVLLDTNILTRLSQQSHPHHAAAASAILALKTENEILYIVPQTLYEFWAVSTRPISANSGLGLTVAQTKTEMARVRSLFEMLPDTPAIFVEWERLVEIHEVKGKMSHDARLVAAMNVHGIKRILSFNDRDFSRYAAVTAINPADLAPQQNP